MQPVKKPRSVLPSGGLTADGALNGVRREVINHGIEAAIGHGYAQGDGVDGPYHSLGVAPLEDLGPHHGVKDEVDVVGDETEAENDDVDDDHP